MRSRLLLLVVALVVGGAACSTSASVGTTTTTRALTTTTAPTTSTTTAAPSTTTPDIVETTTTTRVPSPITAIGDDVTGPGTYERQVFIGAVERSYVLHVGEGAFDTVDVPLVLDLHGLGSNPESQDDLSRMRAKADAEGFVVAQPQADGLVPTWQAGFVPSPDVEFLRAVILDVGFHVDAGPTFVTGFSNGGGMAHRFACDAPDEVVAIATVAGAYPDSGPCSGPVPVVTFHGARDPVVPFLGAGFLLPDIAEWADSWAQRGGCAESSTSEVTESVERVVWEQCDDGHAVQLYVVADGLHGWPGTASRSRLFNSTQDISATELAWDFFATFLD